MKFFVKAKFPAALINDTPVVPERKERFTTRDAAFAWMAEQLDAGATSVVIRPE